ncbi:cadherin-like domain-containing protein, partial [Vibrio sp. 10N.222.55.E8]
MHGDVTLSPGTEDTAVTLHVSDLLAQAGDYDDGETARLSVHNLSADHGTIIDNKDGTYTFNPDADYNGAVHFTYDVQDPQGATVATSASMALAAVADAAVIGGADSGNIKEDVHVDSKYDISLSGHLTIQDPDGPT